MELLRGSTLTSVVREAGRLPWQRAIPILLQLSRALACAHRLGVIHRDLKPHNVMVDDGDRVKLCDFGLSRLYNGDDRITSTGEWVGTPAYMAPEQIRGDEQDARCDFYAFGVTAFEMLTGALPYSATNPLAMVAEILAATRIAVRDRVPADVPPALVALIERCLAGDPDDRPSSAVAIETALLAITAPKPVARPRRWPFVAVAFALALAAFAMWPSAPATPISLPALPVITTIAPPILPDAAPAPEPAPIKPKPIHRHAATPPSDVIIADPFGGT
jgi:serine/threonine-protein kinase